MPVMDVRRHTSNYFPIISRGPDGGRTRFPVLVCIWLAGLSAFVIVPYFSKPYMTSVIINCIKLFVAANSGRITDFVELKHYTVLHIIIIGIFISQTRYAVPVWTSTLTACGYSNVPAIIWLPMHAMRAQSVGTIPHYPLTFHMGRSFALT